VADETRTGAVAPMVKFLTMNVWRVGTILDSESVLAYNAMCSAMFFQRGQVVGVTSRLEEPLYRLKQDLVRPSDAQEDRYEVDRLNRRPAQEGIKRVFVAVEAHFVKVYGRARREGPVGKGRREVVDAPNGAAHGRGREYARPKSTHKGTCELRIAPVGMCGRVRKWVNEHFEEKITEALFRPIEDVDDGQQGVWVGVLNRRIDEDEEFVEFDVVSDHKGQVCL